MPDETLFESVNVPATSGRLLRPFVLTNQNNLLEHLSWGRVAPPESFAGEYYIDLSADAPGRIVLLGVPAPEQLQAMVCSGGANLFPIAVELRAELPKPAPAVTSEGGSTTAIPVSEGKAIAWAPASILPIHSFARFCFRSRDDLEEFQARQSLYPNLDLLTLPGEVAPEFFEATGHKTADLLTPFLSGLTPGVVSTDAYDSLDKTDGLFAVAIAGIGEDASTFEIVAEALFEYTKQVKASKPGGLVPLERLARKLPKPKAERALSRACSEVLSRVQPSREWRPSELLEEIKLEVAAAPLSDRDAKTATQMLERTGRVLAADEAFERRSKGFAILRALELALIRKDPDSYLSWAPEETGADESVRMLGAAMVGLMTGFKRLPISLKPGGIQRLLALNSAQSALWGDPLVEHRKFEIVVEEPSGDHPSSWRLLWEDDVLAEREIRQDVSVFDLLSKVDFASKSGVSFGIEIARRMKWRDCVMTELSFEEGSIVTGPQGTVVTVQGVPSTRYRVISDRLLDRIAAEKLPPELAEYIRSEAPVQSS